MVWLLVLTLKRRGSDVFSNDLYHHSWGAAFSAATDFRRQLKARDGFIRQFSAQGLTLDVSFQHRV